MPAQLPPFPGFFFENNGRSERCFVGCSAATADTTSGMVATSEAGTAITVGVGD
jgi:hypothetical protein